MKNSLKNWGSVVAVVGIVAGLTIVPTLGVWADEGNPNSQVLPPHAYPFGKSYNEWSAEWWKWHFRLPATDHPALSVDGANCGAGQSGKVWFLAAAFTNEVTTNEFNTIVRESCSVPTGKAIFFPIVNIECSTIEPEPYRGDTPDARLSCAKSFIDGPIAVVRDLSVTIDGRLLENLEAYRFQSPDFEFNFEDPSDNILYVDCREEGSCENLQSVSDGYWIMLPPLSQGSHTIRFTGSFRDPDPNSNALFFGLDVTYELTVVGGPKNSR
jgi:hypothetical protein